MLNIALEYRYVIVVVLATVIFAIFDWQKFKSTAYAVMLQAKSMAKDGVLKSGQAQEEWVVQKLKVVLPRRIALFISDEQLRNAVHYLFIKAKDYLDDGKLNSSNK